MATSNIEVDAALIFILALSALLFFLIVFFMVFFIVRFRHTIHPIAKEPWKGTIYLEIGWIIASLVLALAMFFEGLGGFQFLRSTPKDSIVVKVQSRQWSWLFEYDNKKQSPDFLVPIDTNIRADLFSADVIHGFYVPAFRLQQDALPGMRTQVWFKAQTIGSYDILCSQYCGLNHSLMLAKLIVVSREDFSKWLKGEAIALPGEKETPELPAGQKLLADRGCLSCHSITGSAMTGPTLKGLYGASVSVLTNGKENTVTADEAYIRSSIIDPAKDIVDGFPNIMPSGRDILTDDEIGEIVKFIETLK
jgi:cytochrome c oxidase subunit II